MKRSLWSLFMSVSLAVLLALPASAQTPESADHVQPTVAENSRGLLDLSPTGELTLVDHSEPNQFGLIVFVIWNDSEEVVSNVSLKIDVTDAGGALVGVATTSGAIDIAPSVLEPGDIGVGYIYLTDITITSDLTYDFSLSTKSQGFMNEMMPMLEFDGVSWTGSALVGEFTNTGVDEVTLQSFALACLSDEGEIIGGGMDASSLTVAGGATTTFQAGTLLFDTDCSNFILAGNGL